VAQAWHPHDGQSFNHTHSLLVFCNFIAAHAAAMSFPSNYIDNEMGTPQPVTLAANCCAMQGLHRQALDMLEVAQASCNARRWQPPRVCMYFPRYNWGIGHSWE
jgi:hypothetical protein